MTAYARYLAGIFEKKQEKMLCLGIFKTDSGAWTSLFYVHLQRKNAETVT